METPRHNNVGRDPMNFLLQVEITRRRSPIHSDAIISGGEEKCITVDGQTTTGTTTDLPIVNPHHQLAVDGEIKSLHSREEKPITVVTTNEQSLLTMKKQPWHHPLLFDERET